MSEIVDHVFAVKDSTVLNGLEAKWGELFPQASGFPLYVAGASWPTAEHLYQACRFPENPELQDEVRGALDLLELNRIVERNSAMARPDWELVKVDFKRWAIHMKYAQHVRNMHFLLALTGESPIVACKPEDGYWGTSATSTQTLVGRNVLGGLLAELRALVRMLPTAMRFLAIPPEVEGAKLLGEPIGPLSARELPGFTAFRPHQKARRLEVDVQKLRDIKGPNLLERYKDKLPIALMIKNPVFREGDRSNSAPYLLAGKVVGTGDFPSDLNVPTPRRRRSASWDWEEEDDDGVELNLNRYDLSASDENCAAFGVDYCIVWLHPDDIEATEIFFVDTWLAGGDDLKSLFQEFTHLSRLVVGMKLDEKYDEPEGWDPTMWSRICDKLRALPEGGPTKRQWDEWEQWDTEDAFQ
ncbi:MAG: NADAR family protein [Spirochaetales bacterium]